MEDVPCTPNEECRYFPSCYEDTHHIYYPKKRYKAGVERQFRELPENKVELCRALHNEIHATQRPPEKPSRQVMLQALAARAIGDVA